MLQNVDTSVYVLSIFFLDIKLIAQRSCRKSYSFLNQVPVLLGGGPICIPNQVNMSFISFAFK